MDTPDTAVQLGDGIFIRCRQPGCTWRICETNTESAQTLAAYLLHLMTHRFPQSLEEETPDDTHAGTASNAGRV